MEFAIAGITAALLTLFDLDRTFYIPSRTQSKVALYAWQGGFLAANGILAVGLYGIVKDIEALSGLNPWLKAITVGVSYLAIIRVKFSTFNLQGRDVPFGFEAFYEAAKGFVYKRINRIAKAARYDETIELANNKPLQDLVSRAKLSIEQDPLFSPEEKRASKGWIVSVLQDPNATDFDKRAALANFILSGQRSSD